MNIELTYSEAMTVKSAIQNTLTSIYETLEDDSFRVQYPGIYGSLHNKRARCECILDKLQEKLDRLK